MGKIISFLVRNIPRKYLIRFSFLFSRLIRIFYIGNKVECPICGGHFKNFLPYGVKGRRNALCPKCLSLERHRLLWLFLKNKTNFFTENLKVLHVAPEQPVYKKFRKMKNLVYTTADLNSPIADVKLDIQNIPFDDDSFDVVICNHVLEHVKDDKKAMSEIFRILKKDGFALLQVPIDVNRKKTFEDPTITDPKERERLFWQKDHLRLYGMDYADKLRNYGFTVKEEKYTQEIGKKLVDKYRLFNNEVVYLCKK
jgi:predicted SAM-dependent methyltransferase